jgi:hypothetical protein
MVLEFPRLSRKGPLEQIGLRETVARICHARTLSERARRSLFP